MRDDPFIEIAKEWDRDDGFDEAMGETKQEMFERLERLHPHKPQSNGGAATSDSTLRVVPDGKSNTGAQADEARPAPFPWLDMSKWDVEPAPRRK